MNFIYVDVITKQKIKLFGCLSSNHYEKCILYIPGVAGNFFESTFAREIGNYGLTSGYDFLFTHNQGSFQVMKFPYLRKDGNLESIMKGAAYEIFDDCIYDIEAWLRFVKEKGYKKVIVVSHSFGCNKIVHFLNQNQEFNDLISNIILLAPQDMVGIDKLDIHKGMLEEAEKNIKDGYPNKLLSKNFLGFCLISSFTYNNMIKNDYIFNIPYKRENANFSMIQNIKIPIYVIIGTEDGGENSSLYMKKIVDNCWKAKYSVIESANHVFQDKEEELTNLIFLYLNNYS